MLPLFLQNVLHNLCVVSQRKLVWPLRSIVGHWPADTNATKPNETVQMALYIDPSCSVFELALLWL